jgi:hypothetical protein
MLAERDMPGSGAAVAVANDEAVPNLLQFGNE